MSDNRRLSASTLLLWLGLMADCATTEMGIRRQGPDYEANPVGAFLLRRIGVRGVATLLTGLCFSLHRSLRLTERTHPRAFRRMLRLVHLVTALRYAVVIANARTLGPRHTDGGETDRLLDRGRTPTE